MHNLGHPDVSAASSLDPEAALRLLRSFCFFEQVDSPVLHDGETLAAALGEPMYRLRHVPSPYSPDGQFWNEHRVWGSTPSETRSASEARRACPWQDGVMRAAFTVRTRWDRPDEGRRRRPGLRRRALTAAAVAALFATPGCSFIFGEAVGGSSPPTASTSVPPPGAGPNCFTDANGMGVCSIPGRPLRRRRRRGLLLPADDHPRDDEARIEYASVASFGELGLQLMALGAPTELVARCHRAALDEVAHAKILDRLAGRKDTPFGAIPHLLGRRLGGRSRSRQRHLARIAVESYRDGWLNEGASAADFEARAARAATTEERRALGRIAADERRHAELGRDVVLWCFDESPGSVGRALARV